jgi:hypothetical protein
VNYKRKRPKSQRAGCLMCKWWKHERERGGKNAKTLAEKRAELKQADS